MNGKDCPLSGSVILTFADLNFSGVAFDKVENEVIDKVSAQP